MIRTPTNDLAEETDRLNLLTNVAAERAVLGSIMLDSEVADEVGAILRPTMFADPVNEAAFTEMLLLIDRGAKVDPLKLHEKLKSNRFYVEAGGLAYIAQVTNEVPHAASAAYYANMVASCAMRRGIVETSTAAIVDAKNDGVEPLEALQRCERRLMAIGEQRADLTTKNVRDVLQDAMARIDKRKEVGNGIKTGFYDLDTKMRLRPGELIILAARTGMGKTALALNIAANVAGRNEGTVLIVSLEMGECELTERVLSAQSGVGLTRITSGALSDTDRRDVVKACADISQWSLAIDDAPSRSASDVASVARRIKKRDGLALVVVDYIGLMQPDNPRDVRQEQVAKISRRLKGLARELEVPVLCLAQLNRQADTADAPPKLSHLRESGAIEQDADVVLFIHRADYYRSDKDQDGKAVVNIAKQRNGRSGVAVPLVWMDRIVRFESEAKQNHTSAFDSCNARD